MAEKRKLAAILAADVAGYSRLAGSDEERTVARLRALRSDLIDPTIAGPAVSSGTERSCRALRARKIGDAHSRARKEGHDPFARPLDAGPLI